MRIINNEGEKRRRRRRSCAKECIKIHLKRLYIYIYRERERERIFNCEEFRFLIILEIISEEELT